MPPRRIARSAMTRVRTHTFAYTYCTHEYCGALVCLPIVALPCERTAPASPCFPSNHPSLLQLIFVTLVCLRSSAGLLYTSPLLVIFLIDRFLFTSLSHSNCNISSFSLKLTLFVFVSLYLVPYRFCLYILLYIIFSFSLSLLFYSFLFFQIYIYNSICFRRSALYCHRSLYSFMISVISFLFKCGSSNPPRLLHRFCRLSSDNFFSGYQEYVFRSSLFRQMLLCRVGLAISHIVFFFLQY